MRTLTIAALCLSTIAVFALAACGPTGGPFTSTQQVQLPDATPQLPVGVPAVTPHLTPPPAFTADEVIRYVTTHPVPFNSAPPGAITVTQVRFVTSAEVSTLLGGEDTGFPDDYALCYAELAGQFVFPGPPPRPPSTATTTVTQAPAPATYTKAFEVFDATTGNLVMAGSLGQQ